MMTIETMNDQFCARNVVTGPWSRNIAMKIYKQRFVETLGEYRRWKESSAVRNAKIADWATMLQGLELKDKAQMWLTIYLKLKMAQQDAMRH